MLYGAVGGRAGIFLPFLAAGAAPSPRPHNRRVGAEAGMALRSSLAGTAPASHIPASSCLQPGWYPAPLGSWSQQLRHQRKHGLDTKELTSRENKHLRAETSSALGASRPRRVRRGRAQLAGVQGHGGPPSASDL